MTWVFVALTLAGIAITARIILEYANEAASLKANYSRIRSSFQEMQSKMDHLKFTKEQADLQNAELNKQHADLQTTAAELFEKIQTQREAREKRGKFSV